MVDGTAIRLKETQRNQRSTFHVTAWHDTRKKSAETWDRRRVRTRVTIQALTVGKPHEIVRPTSEAPAQEMNAWLASRTKSNSWVNNIMGPDIQSYQVVLVISNRNYNHNVKQKHNLQNTNTNYFETALYLNSKHIDQGPCDSLGPSLHCGFLTIFGPPP